VKSASSILDKNYVLSILLGLRAIQQPTTPLPFGSLVDNGLFMNTDANDLHTG
jgi:hypothetical protein